MSLSTTSNRNDYTGNGATSVYSYTFKIFSQSDLVVIVKNTSDVETTLTLTTDYTVSGVGASAGGSITLVNASQAWLTAGKLTTGYTITIKRVRTLTQTTDIRNAGEFFPETHEDAFDHFIMIDQQQQEQIDRSLQLPESLDPDDFDTHLPVGIESNPGASFIVNDDGDGFDIGPTADEITSAQTYATSASSSATAAASSASAAATSASAASSSASAAAASAAAADWARQVTGTRASPTNITTSGITSTSVSNRLIFVQGSGGAVTVTANPRISAGTNVGQIICIHSRSDTNTLTIGDGNGMALNGDWVGGADSVLQVHWDGTNWCEDFRNDL